MLAEQAKGFDEGWTGEAIKQIAQHIEDIRQAWKIALDMRAFILLTDSLQPLYHYYRIQGLFHEARQLFGRTTNTFRALYEQDNENRQLQELLGRALLRHGRLAWFLADAETDLSISLLQEGLAHLQQASARRDLSRANAYLGEALLRAGRTAEADLLLDRALELYREEDDKNGMATTLELQAVCASQGGYLEEADGLFEESIAVSRHSGNRRLEGRGMHDWGLILLQRGKMEAAAERFMESQAIARELSLRMPIAFNRSMLARIDRCAGQYDLARRRLSDSLQVLEGSGYVFYTVRALNMLGEVEAILEHADEAAQPLAEALEQLKNIHTVDSGIFEDLALDFLVAAGFFFANSDRKMEAGEALEAVFQYADPESDLGQRAQQLADLLSFNMREMTGEAAVPLIEVVKRLRL
jgi:tetratricopeptide (TPR) repeat protein